MEAPCQSSLCAHFASPDRRHSLSASSGNVGSGGGSDHFVVEDLLNFPADDTDGAFDNVTGSSTDSSTFTAIDSGNSSVGGGPFAREPCFDGGLPDGQFSADLCVPYDDMAELEWLSNFVDESFSSEDQQNLHLISGMSSRTADEASETAPDDSLPSQGCGDDGGGSSVMFHSDMTFPAKARSKRSRATTCNWASRLLVLSSEDSSPEEAAVVVHAEEPPAPIPLLVPPQQPSVVVPGGGKKTARSTPKKKLSAERTVSGREALRCLHCATDTTPQWRTGPMGPKTLCNACGVRYKSGRLVPEYRPAASPTFMLTKHSNSHRKVLELRRQKEMTRAAQQQQHIQRPHHQQQFVPDIQNDMALDGGSEDGYLIHHQLSRFPAPDLVRRSPDRFF